jgi:hypothetical protein
MSLVGRPVFLDPTYECYMLGVWYEKWQVTPDNVLWPRICSTSRRRITQISKRTQEVGNSDKEERWVTRISKRI